MLKIGRSSKIYYTERPVYIGQIYTITYIFHLERSQPYRLSVFLTCLSRLIRSRQSTGRFGVFDFIQDKLWFCAGFHLSRSQRGRFRNAVDADGAKDVVGFCAKKQFHRRKFFRTVGVEIPMVFVSESDEIGFVGFDVDAV